MTIGTIDDSQRKAAKAAGLAYLLTFAIVVYVNFGIHDRLIVDKPADTARNVLAHQTMFRVGIVGDLLYCVGVVVMLTALFVILRPVSRGLALLAALWRLVFVLMWLATTLQLFNALRILRNADLEAAPALASIYLGTRADYYYVGLLFGALASTVCGYLWFESRYIPRWLGAFGVASSAWCVACTLVFYVVPSFDSVVNLWWFDTPMGIFDIVTSFWLIFKGLTPTATAGARAQAGAL